MCYIVYVDTLRGQGKQQQRQRERRSNNNFHFYYQRRWSLTSYGREVNWNFFLLRNEKMKFNYRKMMSHSTGENVPLMSGTSNGEDVAELLLNFPIEITTTKMNNMKRI